MKHWWIAFLSVLVVACHDDIKLPPATLKHVVVVYIMAENSLSNYATDDLNEIRQAAVLIPDSCALVVYIDQARSDQRPSIIMFDHTGEHLVYEYRNDPISTDSTFMQQTLAFISACYPAYNYGLVMWSHGSGWLPQKKAPHRTIGVDNGRNDSSSSGNSGQEMEISTLANILRNSGCHWDYIMFDACFMQCVEVAYDLRNVVKWCIGSPAEIPGKGAPYDYIIQELFLDSVNSWKIAEKYYQYYKEYKGVVISAIKTDEMEQLAKATAPLAAQFEEYPKTQGIQVYGPFPKWDHNYYDMSSAIHQWVTDDEYTTWRQALDRAIPYQSASSYWATSFSGFSARITDPDHIACMSMYIPVDGCELNNHYNQTAWWKRMKE